MLFIMGLLAAATMADDRVTFTNRASPQDDLGATRRPIAFELALLGEKWDKQNRGNGGSDRVLTWQDRSPSEALAS
jgi:hypothetical protein